MPTPVILAAVRTPFVRAGEDLRDVPAKELARRVLREVVDRAGLVPEDVDEVVFGNAATPADAPNVARVATLLAGYPEAVPALTVHRNCASGLEAVLLASEKVRAGTANVVACGGAESMSRIPMQLAAEANPFFVQLARARTLPARLRVIASAPWRRLVPRSALLDGLTDPVCGLNMGETAEKLAREFDISRDHQDAFALESHRRATQARQAGRLAAEIAPVFVPPAFERVVADDVGPRENQSREALAKLRPVFDRKDGTVTAGNSCQITDGAAALLVASEEWARACGATIRARIRGHATVGLSPARMGLGPAYAIPRALDQAGVSLRDIGRVEINEAFAAQVIACLEAMSSAQFCETELGRARAVGSIDPARLNPNGGAIALGHPIGATGARLVTTLMHELARSSETLGVASLCVGGGQGSAIVLERVN